MTFLAPFCFSPTGSAGEVTAEFGGLREAEEHGQPSRDPQGQRAGNQGARETKRCYLFTAAEVRLKTVCLPASSCWTRL